MMMMMMVMLVMVVVVGRGKLEIFFNGGVEGRGSAD